MCGGGPRTVRGTRPSGHRYRDLDTRVGKSQISRMATDVDEQVTASRTLPGRRGAVQFVATDALTIKVREHGRDVNAVVLVATGVNVGRTARSSVSTPRTS